MNKAVREALTDALETQKIRLESNEKALLSGFTTLTRYGVNTHTIFREAMDTIRGLWTADDITEAEYFRYQLRVMDQHTKAERKAYTTYKKMF